MNNWISNLTRPEFPIEFTDDVGHAAVYGNAVDFAIDLEYLDEREWLGRMERRPACRDSRGSRIRALILGQELVLAHEVLDDFDTADLTVWKIVKECGTEVFIEVLGEVATRRLDVSPTGTCEAGPANWLVDLDLADVDGITATTTDAERFHQIWMSVRDPAIPVSPFSMLRGARGWAVAMIRKVSLGRPPD